MSNQAVKIKGKKFIDELNARKSNEKLLSADRDLESLMAMRDRRTGKYGISIKEQFANPTGQHLGAKPTVIKYNDRRYVVTHESIPMSHKIFFEKKGRQVFMHESHRVDVIADVIDVIDPSKLPAEAYMCPNCATISSAEELASKGCPSCGTRFSIPQLFPKVSHFSYTEVESEKKKSIFKKSIIPALITYLVIFLITLATGKSDAFENKFRLFFVPLIFALIVYGISSYINLFRIALSDAKQLNNRANTRNDTSYATRVFERTMEMYGPIFNFQYFSSRVYNLLGAMIYAEDKKECPFYSGPDFVGDFDTIIDYVPIGMDVVSFQVDESGKCTIGAKVIADTYSYVKGRVLHRKAEFLLKASKNMNYPIDINFSAHTYKCVGCAGSYDVTKETNCPFCSRPHDVLDEEWYIDGAVKGTLKKYGWFN